MHSKLRNKGWNRITAGLCGNTYVSFQCPLFSWIYGSFQQGFPNPHKHSLYCGEGRVFVEEYWKGQSAVQRMALLHGWTLCHNLVQSSLGHLLNGFHYDIHIFFQSLRVELYTGLEVQGREVAAVWSCTRDNGCWCCVTLWSPLVKWSPDLIIIIMQAFGRNWWHDLNAKCWMWGTIVRLDVLPESFSGMIVGVF